MTKHDAASTGQVSRSAAEIYETFFVPALFGQWTDRVVEAARIQPGDDVLDVGCGTGILARRAARSVGLHGAVTGIDINDGMLAVARQSPEPVSWQQGSAERLPFSDRAFDRVVSQFALMFFTDQVSAVAEMARVARPGGTVTIATWAAVDQSPGYEAMIVLLRRLFGDDVARALEAPFSLGTTDQVESLIGKVSPHVEVQLNDGEARFDSLEAWIHTDIRGWTLADMIDDEQHAELVAAAKTELARFVGNDGRVVFPAPALIATAVNPAQQGDEQRG